VVDGADAPSLLGCLVAVVGGEREAEPKTLVPVAQVVLGGAEQVERREGELVPV
jgi:hypothetical protein